jgi:nucleolar protein 56
LLISSRVCVDNLRLGVLNPHLASLLEMNLSKSSSKAASSSAATSVLLGVEEKNLAGSIKGELGIDCDAGSNALELIRGIRLHAEKMLKGMEAGDVFKAQLGLGHSYSRAKVKVCGTWSLRFDALLRRTVELRRLI